MTSPSRRRLLFRSATAPAAPAASDFEVVRFDGTGTGATGGRLARSGTVMASDSKQLTLGLDWAAYATPASNHVIFDAQSGDFLMDHLASNLMRILILDTVGATAVDIRVDLTGITWNGTRHRLLIGMDTALGSTNGLKVRLDGTNVTPTVNTFANLTMNLSHNTAWDFMCGSGFDGNYEAKNAFFYAKSGAFLDVSDPSNADNFDYANMGADGSGVTGAAADVLIRGPAADYIGGTANKGTGGAWTLTGTVTNV